MENENLLDEEPVETDLNETNTELDLEEELDDIDLLQMEEEKVYYEAKYKELHKEHEKMRKALVSYKKASKGQKHDDDDIDARLDARLEMRDFYKANPEASELKEQIEGYVKKGISRDDAYYLLSRDKTTAQKTAESKTTGRSRVNTGFKKISANEFYKMSTKAQENYIASSLEEFGELSFE